MLIFGMSKIKVCVVGMGYWGPKVARNIFIHPNFELVSVCDLNLPKAQKAVDGFGANLIPVFSDPIHAITTVECDLVILATPPQSHAELGSLILEMGSNLLIEKPVGLSLSEKKILVDLAKKYNSKIFVDHTYLFTPEFARVREAVESGELGSLNYYLSTRVNLGLIQSDISVVEDLAIHDIAILDVLIPELPLYVTCNGIRVEPSTQISSAFMTLSYRNNFMAQISVSWNSPVKVREIHLSGDSGMLLWDDTLGADKVKIFSSNISKEYTDEEFRLSYHIGDGKIPSIPAGEALKIELDYIYTILGGDKNSYGFSGPEHILRTGLVLEALKQSLANSGKTTLVGNQ